MVPTSVRYLLVYLPMRQSYFLGCSVLRFFLFSLTLLGRQKNLLMLSHAVSCLLITPLNNIVKYRNKKRLPIVLGCTKLLFCSMSVWYLWKRRIAYFQFSNESYKSSHASPSSTIHHCVDVMRKKKSVRLSTCCILNWELVSIWTLAFTRVFLF